MFTCAKCSKNLHFIDAQSYVCNFCNFLNEPNVDLNHFIVFGLDLSFDIDLNYLENKYLHLVTVLHPDNQAESEREKAQLHSAILNNAYNNLKQPDTRAEVLFKSLFNEDVVSEVVFSRSKSNEYFLQAFEKLDSVQNSRELNNIRAEIDKRLEDIIYNLSVSFKSKDKKRIKEYYSYLKYTNRLINIANVKEKELNDLS